VTDRQASLHLTASSRPYLTKCPNAIHRPYQIISALSLPESIVYTV